MKKLSISLLLCIAGFIFSLVAAWADKCNTWWTFPVELWATFFAIAFGVSGFGFALAAVVKQDEDGGRE